MSRHTAHIQLSSSSLLVCIKLSHCSNTHTWMKFTIGTMTSLPTFVNIHLKPRIKHFTTTISSSHFWSQSSFFLCFILKLFKRFLPRLDNIHTGVAQVLSRGSSVTPSLMSACPVTVSWVDAGKESRGPSWFCIWSDSWFTGRTRGNGRGGWCGGMTDDSLLE